MMTRSRPSPTTTRPIAAASASSSPSPMSPPMCIPAPALDREARIRGNSVYFPDRVVPMLPERISNDLCSLREGEERPAFACFMVFDADRQQAPAPLRAGGHALGCQALLRGSPGGDRRAAGRQNEAPARAGAATALGCLCGARGGTPTARAARARRPGTPADPRCPWPDRAGGDARAARLAPPGRGVHDRRQCRRGRDADPAQDAAGLPRSRATVAGEGPGARRFSRHDRHRPAEGPGHEAAALQPDPRAGGRHRGAAYRQRGGAADAGAGHLQSRQSRPFRSQPAPLRAFHLADPALCRPDRPSRPHQRARPRARTACRRRTSSGSARRPTSSPPPSAAPWQPSATPSTA